ncbi:MAG: cytochrome c biogenesis protein ResB [Anaerolineae bacterium]
MGLAANDARQRLRQPDPAAVANLAPRWPLQAVVSLTTNVDLAAAELAENLRSEGWRVKSVMTGDAGYAVAERSIWGVLAAPLLALGLLLVLAGLWLGQWAGWREAGIVLAPGQPVRLSQDDSLVLAARPDGAVDGVVVQRNGQPAIDRAFTAWGTGACRPAFPSGAPARARRCW